MPAMNSIPDWLEKQLVLPLANEKKDPTWLTTIRKEAVSKIKMGGLPQSKSESWRYHNFKWLKDGDFSLACESPQQATAVQEALGDLPRSPNQTRLVFVNGRLSSSLSDGVSSSSSFRIRSI